MPAALILGKLLIPNSEPTLCDHMDGHPQEVFIGAESTPECPNESAIG